MSRKKAQFLAFVAFLVLLGGAVTWFAGGKRIVSAPMALYALFALATLYAAANAGEEEMDLHDILLGTVEMDEEEERSLYLFTLLFSVPVTAIVAVAGLLGRFDVKTFWVVYGIGGVTGVSTLYCLAGLLRLRLRRKPSGRAIRQRPRAGRVAGVAVVVETAGDGRKRRSGKDRRVQDEEAARISEEIIREALTGRWSGEGVLLREAEEIVARAWK